MSLLITGLLVFTFAHFSLCLAPSVKRTIIDRFSEKTWKIVFAATVFSGLLMIIFGWRATLVDYAYVAPTGLRHLTMLLMLFAFILFGAAKGNTVIKRYIRHPQLLSVFVWSVAHLLSNGETRSLVLFIGLGSWALLEMVLINKREGQWVKPEPAPLKSTLKNLIISIIVFAIVFSLHKYITGISLIPGN